MSLALFNAVPTGAIEVIFDINNQPWFKRADLGRYLGIIKIRDSFTNFQAEFLKRREEISSEKNPRFGTRGGGKNSHDMFLSLDGVKKVVVGTRKPKAIDLAKMLGIDILSTKILRIEGETLSCILKAFKGEDMKEQYTVDGYIFEIYFPTHKLAI